MASLANLAVKLLYVFRLRVDCGKISDVNTFSPWADMDSHKTLRDLKDVVQKFCEDRDWDQFHGPKDLAIGVVTKGKTCPSRSPATSW